MKLAAALLATLAALTFVGGEDYQHELDEAEFYCEQVNAGAWPNYENRNCGE